MMSRTKRLDAFLDRPGVGLFLALALAFIWSSAFSWWQPASVFNEDFVNYDNGHNLLIADQLLAGKRLYRDVFSSYGPLPAYLQAAWAYCFGNTVRTDVGLTQTLTLLNVGLLYGLLRRSISVPVTLVWLGGVVFPFLLYPGTALGGSLLAIYPGCQRCLLLLIALSWVEPHRRSYRRACLLGALLGVLEWVKFGGGFVAGAALLITDLLVLGRSLADREVLRSRLGMMLGTLAGFLAVQLSWTILVLLTLPRPIAFDVLWPAYMLKNYASFGPDAPTPFTWPGFRQFMVSQWPVVVVVPLNVVLVWRALAPPSDVSPVATSQRQTERGALVFCALFFSVAVTFYFPYSYLAIASAWIFLAAGAYVFNGLRTPGRIVIALALLPPFCLNLRTSLKGWKNTKTLEVMVMPNGEKLWLKTEVKSSFTRTRETIEELARQRNPPGTLQPPAVMILPVGSGWFHFFQYRHYTRHTWTMVGLVRPDEEAALVDSLSQTLAVVVYSRDGLAGSVGSDPEKWPSALSPRFAPAVNAALARWLDAPIHVDAYSVVFPVKHPGASPGGIEPVRPTSPVDNARP